MAKNSNLVEGKEKRNTKELNLKTAVQMKKRKKSEIQNLILISGDTWHLGRHRPPPPPSDHINCPALLLQFALPRRSRPSMSPRCSSGGFSLPLSDIYFKRSTRMWSNGSVDVTMATRSDCLPFENTHTHTNAHTEKHKIL